MKGIVKLNEYAARLNFTPRLLRVSLANVLSGDTCSPIALPDFEGYLTHVEYTVENLQFVIWYQDYRRRFFALPPEIQALSPGQTQSQTPTQSQKPCALAPRIPTRALVEAHRASSARRAKQREQSLGISYPPTSGQAASSAGSFGSSGTGPSNSTYSGPSSSGPSSYSGPSDMDVSVAKPPPTLHLSTHRTVNNNDNPKSGSPIALTPSTPSLSPSSSATTSSPSLPTLPSSLNLPPLSPLSPPAHQPFRSECARVLATFFHSNSPKELSLDAALREAVVGEVGGSTHPDCFLPVYEQIYHVLETVSLPRFLGFATVNMNRPRQILWYALSYAYLIACLAVTLPTTCMLPTPPEANRAWRLFALPFMFLFGITVYSTWRGFCGHVWTRNSVQLRPWELDDLGRDEESEPGENTLRANAGKTSTRHRESRVEFGHKRGSTTKGEGSGSSMGSEIEMDVIAPFGEPPLPDEERRARRKSASASVSVSVWSDDDEEDGEREREKKVQVSMFGPEKVVLDSRIVEVHRKVLKDVFVFGGWLTLAYAVVLLPIPNTIRRR